MVEVLLRVAVGAGLIRANAGGEQKKVYPSARWKLLTLREHAVVFDARVDLAECERGGRLPG